MKRGLLLLPGAWSGAWVWEPVVRRLRRLGFPARAVTLRGLCTNHADVSGVGLETHVNDVLDLLRADDLRETVIVAHSYSGLVAGLVADRARDLVAHTVFVEALLPHHGRSMLHAFPERQRALELQLIDAHGGRWPAPDHTVVGDVQDLTPAQARWLAERLVDHPGRTVAEPVVLNGTLARQRASYVVCSRDHVNGCVAADVAAMRAAPTWDFHTLDAGYWPMVSVPGPLADLLARIADREG